MRHSGKIAILLAIGAALAIGGCGDDEEETPTPVPATGGSRDASVDTGTGGGGGSGGGTGGHVDAGTGGDAAASDADADVRTDGDAADGDAEGGINGAVCTATAPADAGTTDAGGNMAVILLDNLAVGAIAVNNFATTDDVGRVTAPTNWGLPINAEILAPTRLNCGDADDGSAEAIIPFNATDTEAKLATYVSLADGGQPVVPVGTVVSIKVKLAAGPGCTEAWLGLDPAGANVNSDSVVLDGTWQTLTLTTTEEVAGLYNVVVDVNQTNCQ